MTKNDDSKEKEAYVLEEFHDFYKDFPSLSSHFKLISKIGEGSFSTVYKAIDLNHHMYDNVLWCEDHESKSCDGLVALKRIYVTSSPERILNELGILHILNGHPRVVPIITALRHEDQVIAVMPYFQHEDFRDYYLDLTNDEIKHYMLTLLQSMEYIHSRYIIHRDVKPSNFLYSRTKRRGVLVDFGLAQFEVKKRQRDWTNIQSPEKLKSPFNAENQLKSRKDIGYIINDPRPSIHAYHAGTRGFRAPEVLFRVKDQTGAIDIWSCGVIFLSILSGMFPFFASKDNIEAIMEISHIFGKKEMEMIGHKFGRSFHTNLPSIGRPQSLRDIVIKFNPKRKTFPKWGFDLLELMLKLDPEERISAETALNNHPYFNPEITSFVYLKKTNGHTEINKENS